MSNRKHIILLLALRKLAGISSLFISSIIVSWPKICQVSEDFNGLIFTHDGIPLSNENIKPVKASMVKFITGGSSFIYSSFLKNIKSLV